MQIRAIRLQNVRRFIDPVEIGGLGPGINVLAAPNERGKSTFFDALHAAFFLPCRSMNADVRSLIPHAGGDPEVTVSFDANGASWRLEKRWSKAAGRRSARLWRNGTLSAQAGQAEDQIAELLSPPADGGPAGLLWVRQGLTELGARGDEAKTRHTLLTSVAGEVDAMTGGRQMEALSARIEAELAQNLTSKGPRKGGPLHAAAAEVASLEERYRELRAASADLSDALAQRHEKRAERARLTDPEDSARRQGALADAEAALKDAERHETALQTARDAARMASVVLQSTTTERTRLNEALTEQREAHDKHHSAQDVYDRAKSDAEASGAAAKSAGERKTLAHQAEQSARSRHAAALRAERAQELEARRRDLEQRLQAAEEARRAAEAARAEAQSGPTDARMAELRKRQTALSAAHLARDTAAPSITLSYSGEGRVRREGTALPADAPIPLPDGGTFELDGIGRLTLAPGAAGASDAVVLARADLDRTLADAGFASLAAAEEAVHARTIAETALAQATATLRAAAPEGIDALRTSLARMPAPPAPDTSLPSLQDADDAMQAAGDTLLEASAEYEAARSRQDAAQSALAHAEAALAAAGNRVERAAHALAMHEDPQAVLSALDLRHRAESEALGTATRTLGELERVATDISALTARFERASAAVESARQALQTLAVDLRGLDTYIETRASAAIEEELQDSADRLAEAQRRHAAIEEDCAVLQRLAQALSSAREAAQEHYLAPVLAELEPLVRMLWPEAALTLDPETLLPSNLTRRDTPEAFDILSGGTREQIALLVRLAFARMLAREGRPAPVILDDAIVFADDDRIVTMFDALTRQASDLQVIVFSCRQRAFRDLGGQALTITPAEPPASSPVSPETSP